MRLGLDLRGFAPDRQRSLAVETDRLGLWAVLLDGTDALVAAASLAVTTEHVHLAIQVDTGSEHPFTLAEEIAVLDHLSRRRALVIVKDSRTDGREDRLRRWLASEIVDGVALTPPPAQTVVPVWSQASLVVSALSGDPEADRAVVDRHRDGGITHLFVSWPGPLPTLARHLATRAAVASFPQLVADLADRL